MIHSNRINKQTKYPKARFYSKNKNLEIKLLFSDFKSSCSNDMRLCK